MKVGGLDNDGRKKKAMEKMGWFDFIWMGGGELQIARKLVLSHRKINFLT